MTLLRELLARVVLSIVGPLANIVQTIEWGLQSEYLLDNILSCAFIVAVITICCIILAIGLLKVALALAMAITTG